MPVVSKKVARVHAIQQRTVSTMEQRAAEVLSSMSDADLEALPPGVRDFMMAMASGKPALRQEKEEAFVGADNTGGEDSGALNELQSAVLGVICVLMGHELCRAPR